MWFIPIVLLVSRGAFVHVAFASPAPVSTVGKSRLVVVAVQGAPLFTISGNCIVLPSAYISP